MQNNICRQSDDIPAEKRSLCALRLFISFSIFFLTLKLSNFGLKKLSFTCYKAHGYGNLSASLLVPLSRALTNCVKYEPQLARIGGHYAVQGR